MDPVTPTNEDDPATVVKVNDDGIVPTSEMRGLYADLGKLAFLFQLQRPVLKEIVEGKTHLGKTFVKFAKKAFAKAQEEEEDRKEVERDAATRRKLVPSPRGCFRHIMDDRTASSGKGKYAEYDEEMPEDWRYWNYYDYFCLFLVKTRIRFWDAGNGPLSQKCSEEAAYQRLSFLYQYWQKKQKRAAKKAKPQSNRARSDTEGKASAAPKANPEPSEAECPPSAGQSIVESGPSPATPPSIPVRTYAPSLHITKIIHASSRPTHETRRQRKTVFDDFLDLLLAESQLATQPSDMFDDDDEDEEQDENDDKILDMEDETMSIPQRIAYLKTLGDRKSEDSPGDLGNLHNPYNAWSTARQLVRAALNLNDADKVPESADPDPATPVDVVNGLMQQEAEVTASSDHQEGAADADMIEDEQTKIIDFLPCGNDDYASTQEAASWLSSKLYQPHEFQRALRRLKIGNARRLRMPGMNVAFSLNGWQVVGTERLLDMQDLKKAEGAILADEMGLGKTVQMVGHILAVSLNPKLG
jgi:SNF2-related domain